MRVVLRILAAAFLALAVVLLVADGTAMLAANAFIATPLATTISSLMPGTLEAVQAAVQENVHPLLWEPTITTLLAWPGWVVIGAIGLVLAVLGRSRSRRHMVSIDQY
ncbi:hypothetical protein [Pelagibacterium mangrovi]|uniref:hypothetical protein n=1 Tax=Pelagibacterium mangrovi TaxID=3119828 RepID=UPI002FC647D7